MEWVEKQMKTNYPNVNPLPRKTKNPNWEPWLTWTEALFGRDAIKRGYARKIQNGSRKDGS